MTTPNFEYFYNIMWYVDSKGRKTQYLRYNIPFQVAGGKIELGEIPDSVYKIRINGMTEISLNGLINSATKFKCNYNTGTLYFDSSQEGAFFNITFSAKGKAKYYSRNMILEDKYNVFASDNVEDALYEAYQRINNLITSNPQPLEIQDARLDGATGIAYDTLGSRLNYYGTELKNAKIDTINGITYNTIQERLNKNSQDIADNKTDIGDMTQITETNLVSSIKVDKTNIDGLTTLTKPYNSDKEIVFGQEYLSTFHKSLMNTSPYTIVMSGDSTTEGLTVTDKYKVHNILKSILDINGLPFGTVLNHGHSGQGTYQWSQTYVNDDIASAPKLLVVRWGLNDPAGGASIADTEYSLRDGLTKFRTAIPYAQCSIVLMTPNSTNDDVNGRGQAWHKAINEMYRRVARDFQCCFIDIYALLQDSYSSVASEYMDNTSGVHVHPLDVMNMSIMSKVYDVIVPKTFHMSSTNRFINDAYIGLLSANGLPSFFNRGISIYKADVNFPYPNCPVYTIKSMDDVLMQTNYSSDKTKYVVRTGKQSTDTWNEWSYIGGGSPKGDLTLVNSWQNFGDPAKLAKYWISSNNEIVLEGVIKLGTVGMTVCTLPVAPLANEYFNTPTSTGIAKFVVQGDGQLVCLSASDNAWVSLSGIRCRLD